MSEVKESAGTPRAVVHKRILEVAQSRPDASLAEVADEVSGATPDLVERVLGEYGDPGDATNTDDTMSQNGQHAADSTADTDGEQHDERVDDEPADEATPVDEGADPAADATETEKQVDPPALTDAQLETVSAVYEYPEATQGEIADHLGVSRATVSRRLNDVPGFEWTDREPFAADLFDTTDLTPVAVPEEVVDTDDDQPGSGVPAPALDGVEQRLDAIEGHLASDATDGDASDDPPLRPELAQKVVHAAMHSDRITEDEELELLEALLEW